MQLKQRIQSFVLLTVYLIVLVHGSISHTHFFNLEANAIITSQTHADLHDNSHHHKHDVHIGMHEGLIHFLGDLFEGVNHMYDPDDEHVFATQKVATTKNFTSVNPSHITYVSGSVIITTETLIELRVPPDDQLPSDLYLNWDHLQRGPPSLG